MKEKHCFLTLRKWVIICGLSLLFPLFTYSQHQKITVDIRNMPLNKAMEQISEQASMNVAYSKEFVDADKVVSLKVSNMALKDALSILLKGDNIGFSFHDNSILLFKKNEQKTNQNTPNVKKVKVSGQITDSNTGESIIGATIAVLGTSTGTITDFDGKYALSLDAGSTIQISYVGYVEVKKTINKEGTFNVALEENTTQLEDVVVVGYGTQKKLNLTGAVSMVKGNEIASRPITSVGAGLQGTLPGVTITSASGQPGASVNIKIRGVSTINSDTNPLILIDGVAGGDMNLLNPSDVESVSVLKDAASAAIYGARAANGVILVTTKKGNTKEKASLSYNGYVGFQTPTALPTLVNGRQYMDLSNEAMAAAGFSKPYLDDAYTKYDSGNYPNDYSNTDWIKQIYKKSAFQTGHNVSVKGGNEKSAYFMSYGYLDQDGLVVGDSFKSKRHNARISANTEVFDRLKLNGNVSLVDYSRSQCGYSGTSGVFRLAQRISPLLPVKWQKENGNGGWQDSDYYSSGMVKNPLDVAYNSGTDERKTRVFNAIAGADLKIIEGLNLGSQYSSNYYFRDNNEFNPVLPQYYANGTPDPANENLRNYISQENLNILTQTIQVTLKYNKEIKGHEIGALAGFSQEWEERSNLFASRKNIILENIHVIDAGTEDIINGGNRQSWALRSYFGRVNYAYKGRYLLEANMRIDGTSRFARDNRWGYFPSCSAGWNFSREKFFDFAKPVLTSGKLRASWGELGNQNVGSNYYPYLTPIESADKSYPIGGINNVGFVQNKLGNKKIKWETIRMLNVGLDLSFFNNRLNASFDWYKKQNIDALVKPVYPTIVGVSGSANLPFENLGEIENKGWELYLQWRDEIGEVHYDLTFNLADSRNKITDLGKSAPSLGKNIRREGDPIDAYYGFLTDGLAQASDFEGKDDQGRYINPKFAIPAASAALIQPGDIKYRNISGDDNVIDDKDKVVLGDPFPHYTYSFKGAVEWKGIDFSFYLQGVGKVDGYLTDEARHCFINDYSVPKIEHLDRWTPSNTGATYPRMYQSQTHNLLVSDYWIEDASYLRLKNIQLGYSLPSKWLKPLKIAKLRVYASADNLLTFTHYFGAYDPEVRESAGDAYPQVKTYVFGLNLTF